MSLFTVTVGDVGASGEVVLVPITELDPYGGAGLHIGALRLTAKQARALAAALVAAADEATP